MVRTDQLTWTEYVEKLEANPLVLLPVGAHEQHGPHLPMGTDAIFATKMAEAIAANLNGLAITYLALDDLSAAERALREALTVGQQSDSTPDTLGSIGLLGH